MTGRREWRVARNIRGTSSGWRVGAKIDGQIRWHRLRDPLHERTFEQLKIDRDEWQVAARHRFATKAPAGASFADEVHLEYLRAVAAMPDLRARRRDLERWCAALGELLGAGFLRSAVRPKHIQQIRDRWLTVGPKRVQRGGRWVDVVAPLHPQTVALRMRALENVWTVLDGKRAPNPVREVAEPDSPPRPPKSVPYSVVERILAEMPERRHAFTLTPAAVARIRAALARPPVNHSKLARRHRVSEALIRKIARLGDRYRVDVPATATLVARAIAYTGFSHGELYNLTAADLHLDEPEPWVWVTGRRKGRGTAGETQPLTAAGAAAIRALAEAGLLGRPKGERPSASSIRAAVHRACARAQLPLITTYAFRHSYATEVLRRTGSLDATQQLMRHKDRRTSAHYSAAAVDPARAALVRQLEASGAFTGGEPAGNFQPEKQANRGDTRRQPTTPRRGQSSRR